MPPKKAVSPAPAQRTLSAAEPERPSTAPTAPSSGRKPWIKRTPVEVMLEQIGKQEDRVAAMREELAKEERELQKLQKAKTVLESL